jgi:hypothetical protein
MKAAITAPSATALAAFAIVVVALGEPGVPVVCCAIAGRTAYGNWCSAARWRRCDRALASE